MKVDMNDYRNECLGYKGTKDNKKYIKQLEDNILSIKFDYQSSLRLFEEKSRKSF